MRGEELLAGLDDVLRQQRPRRLRVRWGWRQIAVQVLYVIAVSVLVVSLVVAGEAAP
ncbi:hypothetical protein AB0D04_02010 [Streptomyces sp. NPDC048483]|uniref:hypothetical protein n=1 Tax=Streptomyces sp. NPDC048483 TaxID=3154927 RepID=UPI0034401FAE